MVNVVTVKSNKDLRSFIKFPEKLYKNHPQWVPPLRMDEFNTLKRSAPAFKHCEAEYFLAYKGGEIVGRVAAIINNVANTQWGEKVVRFGWIEFIDDFKVSSALIKAVVDWGKLKGMTLVKGPLGFSDMDKEGDLHIQLSILCRASSEAWFCEGCGLDSGHYGYPRYTFRQDGKV